MQPLFHEEYLERKRIGGEELIFEREKGNRAARMTEEKARVEGGGGHGGGLHYSESVVVPSV